MLSALRDIFLTPWHDVATLDWPIVVEGALVSCALGLLGCFLVIRGMSLLGDALSHAVLPGIAIGFLVSARWGHASLSSPWILVGATVVGLAAAVLVETVRSQSRVKEDASLGIVFTTMFALGVVLISRYSGQADLDPGCVLYGNIEYFVLKPDAVWPMAVILGLIVVGIVVFYRPLLVSTFDRSLAVSVGIAAGAVHYGLMGALSLTIVASFEAVGAILAVALLIIPGATARLWTQRLSTMLWLSAAFAIAGTLLGYWLSHRNLLNTSAGAAIAAAGFGVFVISWLLSPSQGLISRWLARRGLVRKIALENLVKTIAEVASPAGAGHATASALREELNWDDRTLSRVAARSARRGWVARDGDRLSLTPAGAARARRLAEAHQAWEAYLHRELKLPTDHVHDAAEWIEHYLEEEKVSELSRE